MIFPKYQTLKDLDNAEIETRLLKLKKELLYLRIQKSNFSKKSPHLLKATRHQIAQLLTFKRRNMKTPDNYSK